MATPALPFAHIAESVSLAVDGAGMAVIVLGLLYALLRALRPPPPGPSARYRQLRQDMGRGILLGLELMVAGDIIRTVAVTPTLRSVAVLGGIVLIRTFLSISLEVELQGRWPWQPERDAAKPQPSSSDQRAPITCSSSSMRPSTVWPSRQGSSP